MLPGRFGVIRKLVVLLKALKRTPDHHLLLEISEVLADTSTPALPSLPDDLSLTDQSAGPQCTSTPRSVTTPNSSGILHQTLPRYSERVQTQLEKGNIIQDFDKMVEETAYFLLGHGDIQDRGAYQDYGRAIYAKYPCIGYPGKEPWTFFCKKLSQKLRNIRWRKKRRSESSINSSSTSKKARRCLEMANVVSEEESMSYEEAAKEIRSELEKPSGQQDRALVKKLSRCSFKGRRECIGKMGDAAVKKLTQEFPLLGDIYYIRSEFETLQKSALHGKERFHEILTRIEQVLHPDTESVSGSEDEKDTDAMALQLLLDLEKKLSPQRKKSLPPAITVVDATEAQLTGPANSPPRLIMARHGSGMQGVVVADGVMVPLEAADIISATMDLLACYYAWDLNFPTQYQLLTFLQVHVLEDSTDVKRGNILTKFEKEFTQD